MVARRDIMSFAKRVVKEFAPDRIVLFGSHANGKVTDDSDVDLLVIMKHNKRNVEQSLAITRRIDRSFPLDLIVRRPDEARHRIKMHDMFLQSILTEGKTLYAKRNERMGRKGGG